MEIIESSAAVCRNQQINIVEEHAAGERTEEVVAQRLVERHAAGEGVEELAIEPLVEDYANRERIEVVAVDLIDYSQPTLSQNFGDGRDIDVTIQMLDDEQIDPLYPQFKLLEVVKVQREQRYISKDHRRLYCFKQHQQNSGKCIRTRVKIIADVYDRRAFENLCDRYNPVNHGYDIRVLPRRHWNPMTTHRIRS